MATPGTSLLVLLAVVSVLQVGNGLAQRRYPEDVHRELDHCRIMLAQQKRVVEFVLKELRKDFDKMVADYLSQLVKEPDLKTYERRQKKPLELDPEKARAKVAKKFFPSESRRY